MAISLCSALLLVTVSQAPPLPVAPTDSLTRLRGRAAQDSSDAQLWLLMGRAYLGLGVEAHGATHRSSEDSVWTRAVLDELGENLLRACPAGGLLLTAGDADFYAAWYMRFARGLRPDLLVLPLAAWRSTPATRGPSPRSRPTPGPRAPRPRCAMRWRRSRWPPTCRRAGNNVTYHQARTGRQPRRDRLAHHPRLPRGGP